MNMEHNLRALVQKFNDDLTIRTYPGDTVKCVVTYQGQSKPLISCTFTSRNLGEVSAQYTSLLPETPWYVEKVESGLTESGEPTFSEARRGASSWREFIHYDAGPCFAFKRACEASGREFAFEEKS